MESDCHVTIFRVKYSTFSCMKKSARMERLYFLQLLPTISQASPGYVAHIVLEPRGEVDTVKHIVIKNFGSSESLRNSVRPALVYLPNCNRLSISRRGRFYVCVLIFVSL